MLLHIMMHYEYNFGVVLKENEYQYFINEWNDVEQ